MTVQTSGSAPASRRLLARLGWASTAALAASHLTYILATELSRAGMVILLDLPFWHNGTRLMMEDGHYRTSDLGLAFGAPLLVVVLTATGSALAFRRLIHSESSWALWYHWMTIVGVCHVAGSLLLGLDPNQEMGYLFAWISFQLNNSINVGPYFATAAVLLSIVFLKSARSGFFRTSPSRTATQDNPTLYLVSVALLPWTAVTLLYWIAIPEVVTLFHRLVIWGMIGCFLVAATFTHHGVERSFRLTRSRRISGTGTFIVPGVLAAVFYALGYFGD